MPDLRAIWALCVTTSNIYDLVFGNSGQKLRTSGVFSFSNWTNKALREVIYAMISLSAI